MLERLKTLEITEGEEDPVKVLSLGVRTEWKVCRPVTAGLKLHIAEYDEAEPIVDTPIHVEIRFPLIKNRTFPGALVVTETVAGRPLKSVPENEGTPTVANSLLLVTVTVTVKESDNTPSETQAITM